MTGAASAITATSATVAGTVNPVGQATTYAFQYGTTVAYGQQTPALSAGSGTANVSVSASLTGLSPATTYHYRVTATNASGTTPGPDQTFTTLGAAPVAVTGAASAITATPATVAGTVNPVGQATTYAVQYGTTLAYGQQTPALSAGSGTANVPVTASLTGLSPASHRPRPTTTA